MPHRPSWFQDGSVVVANSPTCGINKDGAQQFKVSEETGERSKTEIDNQFQTDIENIVNMKFEQGNVFRKPLADVRNSNILVPQYYDYSQDDALREILKKLPEGFKLMSLQQLVDGGKVALKHGHGSPSADQRIGEVPYVKVSDLRSGQVNINPTNMIPKQLAEKFWRGEKSNLEPYDLVSPERASKNIGEFSVLMPGQEQIVLTKEVIIIRSLDPDLFDQFYLIWALTLNEVRAQWNRIVFMQTNREDVGDRTFEIKVPVPPSKAIGEKVSESFRDYFTGISALREKLAGSMGSGDLKHHFYLS